MAVAVEREPVPPVSLAGRLAHYVVRLCGLPTLTCAFRPGGRVNGFGMPSQLYCRDCGKHEDIHDIARAAHELSKERPLARTPARAFVDANGQRVRRVAMWVCESCLSGPGGICTTPGCAFIRLPAPSMPLHAEDVEYPFGAPSDEQPSFIDGPSAPRDDKSARGRLVDTIASRQN
jgi:hypothetical protein